MAVLLAPYTAAMRIGQGFNSYTQEICLDRAVTVDDAEAGGDHFIKGEDQQISQIVSYASRHVTKLSQITDAMNVSPCLSIRSGVIGGSSGGSFIDADKFKESDINYFVQVQVTNQVVMAEDVTKFMPLDDNPANNLDGRTFTKLYGDCYISGFIEGGELDAIISIKCATTGAASVGREQKKKSMRYLEAVFGKGIKRSQTQSTDNQTSDIPFPAEDFMDETTITVNWNGGGDIKPAGTLWSVDSVAAAAAAFPTMVAKTPQRTYAILSKYSALRSYQKYAPKDPQNFNNADIYTNNLLDEYMDFKNIWKELHLMTVEWEYGRGEFLRSAFQVPPARPEQKVENDRGLAKELIELFKKGPGKDNWATIEKALKRIEERKPNHYPNEPYEPTIAGVDKARKLCRTEMIRIVQEVESILDNPEIASDPDHAPECMNSALLRRLIPKLERHTDLIGTSADVGFIAGEEGNRLYVANKKELPPHIQSWASSLDVKDQEKAKDFKMSEYFGSAKAHSSQRTFNDFNKIHNSFQISQIRVSHDDIAITGIELYFKDKQNVLEHGRKIKDGDPNVETHPIQINEKILGVVMIGRKNDPSGPLLLSSIKILTNNFQSTILGIPDEVDSTGTLTLTGSQSEREEMMTMAPNNAWSLKGLWGQKTDDGYLDRLGVIYGFDSKKVTPAKPSGQILGQGNQPVLNGT